MITTACGMARSFFIVHQVKSQSMNRRVIEGRGSQSFDSNPHRLPYSRSIEQKVPVRRHVGAIAMLP